MKKRFFIFLCSLFIFAFSCSDDGKNNLLYQYHSPEEIEAFLDEVALKYPNITSLDTVGYSQEGRAIRALIISDRDYPSSTLPDPEPRVRFVGAIHGNEKISAEILIRLIEYLTYNYEKDPTITELINSRYIVVIPVL
ncbi:MAG TPA: M14 family zinc carboxypeptidase, partial [Spirochaetota bacterium]|nr:M14 family zinc carboxypeptidase [Spirochaetota bacterium]